jgi:hypothetical protein
MTVRCSRLHLPPGLRFVRGRHPFVVRDGPAGLTTRIEPPVRCHGERYEPLIDRRYSRAAGKGGAARLDRTHADALRAVLLEVTDPRKVALLPC